MPLTEDATLEQLFPHLLNGDRVAAFGLIDECLDDGMTPEHLRMDVLRPLAIMIDRLQQSTQLTPAAYTRAFDLLDLLGGRLREPSIARSAPPPMRPPHRSRFVRRTFSRGVLSLRLAGPSIGEREASIVGEEILALLRSHGRAVRTLVLDFSEVRVMSSIGLNLCIDVRNTAQSLGARTIAYGLRRELRKLFSLTRVDRLYEMPRTREELRRALAV